MRLKPFACLLLLFFQCRFFQAQTPAQLEYLKTLAKVSGYVRYFHPSDEAYRIEWNNFNILAAQRVLNCQSQQEFETVLNELFKPLAPTIEFVKSQSNFSYDRTPLQPKARKLKYTNWQHFGVGSDMNNYFSLYASSRSNVTEAVIADRQNYAALTQNIIISAYIGKRIRLQAKVKMEKDKEGECELWMNLADNNNSTLTQSDIYGDVIRSGEWADYAMETVVRDNADYMTFGLIVRAGVAYMDDVRLSYFDGKDWQNIPMYDAGFDMDGKDHKPDYRNWFYNEKKGLKVSYVPVEAGKDNRCARVEYTSNLYHYKNSFKKNPVSKGAVIRKSVGSGLDMYLPLSLPVIKGETSPKADARSFMNLKKQCLNYEKGRAQYLGNVITTWNVFRHFYPYFDVLQTDWDEVLELSLQRSFNDRSDYDHKATLERMLAPLRDAHVSVMAPHTTYDDFFKPGFDWAYAEGKLVVTKVCDTTLGIKKGQVVNRVNGRPTEEFIDSFRSITSVSNEGWFTVEFGRFSLAGLVGTTMTLEIEGKTLELKRNIPFYNGEDIACACTPLIMQNKFRFLDSGVLYLNLTVMSDEDVKVMMPEILKARGLICDLRGYPSVGWNFIRQLMTSPEKDQWMFVPELYYPDYDSVTYIGLGWHLKPLKPHISAKTIFITGPGAVSYGESFLGYIQGLKLAELVGIPSAGTNGNVNRFFLPGGFKVMFTGMKVLKHDGTILHTIGFIPEHPSTPTLEEILNDDDVQLKKAQELLKK